MKTNARPRMHQRPRLAWLTPLACALLPQAALSQGAALEDIFVTVEKCEQCLQDVPESVTAFAGSLSENVAAKLAVSSPNRSGYSRSIANGQDLDGANNITARSQFLYSMSGTNEVLFGLDYSENNNSGPCRVPTKFDQEDHELGGAFVSGTQAALAASGVTRNPRECEQSVRQFVDRKIYGTNLTIDVSPGPLSGDRST